MEMTMSSTQAPPKCFISSLSLVATSYSLRCDAKHADSTAIAIERKIRSAGYFELGEFLPGPFVKGIQPEYLDQPNEESVPVVNTLSIQNLSLRVEDCRHISSDDYEAVSSERRLRKGDVLVTVDGGVSIGKPLHFDLVGDFTVDSHVVILRPEGLRPLSLVYLLASPLGQMQFRRAESGANGQTTVTEDDVRRFIFPRDILNSIDQVATTIERERCRIAEARTRLAEEEASLWRQLDKFSA